MKKIVFCAALLLCCLSAKSQLVIDGSGSFVYRSLEDLNRRMRLGLITFGDSITMHMFNLTLEKESGNGNFLCKLAEHDLGFYRVGKYSPSSVLVSSKSYLVDGFVLSFVGCPEDVLRRNLILNFGKPTEEKEGQLFWFASKVCVMAQKSDEAYLVVFKKL